MHRDSSNKSFILSMTISREPSHHIFFLLQLDLYQSKSILPQIIKLPKQDLENKPIEIETLLQLQYKFLLDLSDE